MEKGALQQDTYDQLINEYAEYKSLAGGNLLDMARIITEAKNRLPKKHFKKFLKDPRINLKSFQAKKKITVYEMAKGDSRLTLFIKNEGIEKSYLITTIKDPDTRNIFLESITNISLTVRQLKQALYKINVENKTPAQAIDEVQNKIGLAKPKKAVKTIALEEYEKLKNENQHLKDLLSKFEKKQPVQQDQKTEKVERQRMLNLSLAT